MNAFMVVFMPSAFSHKLVLQLQVVPDGQHPEHPEQQT